MFLLYFLDIYINLVKCLERVPLDVSINCCYLHKDAGKTYLEISNMRLEVIKNNHLQAYEKEYWRLSSYERIIRGRTTKTVCSTKEKYVMTNQTLARRNGKLFCRKRDLVKVGISSCIIKETVCRVLPKTDPKWTHFQRKEIMSKNDLKLRLKFARKVYCKRATCNYEI